MKDASGHDHGYKRLFSHPQTVEELLRGFLNAEWVKNLDFSTLERVGNSFVSEDHRERRTDVIWRVLWKDGKRRYDVYLLLEFQSTSDPFMAVRILTYVGLLLEEIIRKRKLRRNACLPIVLPIVFYNGKRPWLDPVELGSLFGDAPEGPRSHLPSLRYLLLDESRMDLSRPDLAGNRVAMLFRIEISRDLEDVLRLTRELVKLLPSGQDPELHRIITAWLASVLRRTFPDAIIPETVNLEDFPMSLEGNMAVWIKRKRAEGMHEILLRQLNRRFGPIPEEVRSKVEKIHSTRRLNTLADKILTAGSLRELGL
ncbi:MAG TPA: Rpn family recombination-promoting nuclease/putative transposase [Thermoanaerobaculia bacterium]|nr:Rpn family recombination-promoting nuclease/putative transposase [Thermoanaerobaculia bacterium]